MEEETVSYICGLSLPGKSGELRGLPWSIPRMTFWLSARLFESPELYWSFYKLCWNEAPLRRPFLKILYENADTNKNNHDAEILKTSNLSNKIVCRPPHSRETIPLSFIVLYVHCTTYSKSQNLFLKSLTTFCRIKFCILLSHENCSKIINLDVIWRNIFFNVRP